MKNSYLFVLLSIILLIAFSSLVFSYGSIIQVSSQYQTVNKDSRFNVTIQVSNIIDLYGYQFTLRFDPNILEAIGISSTEFLVIDNASRIVVVNRINNTAGNLEYAETRIAVPRGVNGSGALAIIDFNSIANGISVLGLENVLLANSSANEIKVGVVNGSVNVGWVTTTTSSTTTTTFTPTTTLQTTTTTLPSIPTNYIEGFENGFGNWTPDNDYRVGAPWNISISNKQAYEGNYSVRMYIDASATDDGTIWIEKPIPIPPMLKVLVNIEFQLYSSGASDVNNFFVVAHGNVSNPEIEEDFVRIGYTDEIAEWKKYNYTTILDTGSYSKVWLGVGISAVWEVARTYYIDLINVSISEIQPCSSKGDQYPCDGIVDDFELLTYIDQWAKGLVTDFDLLTAIDNWAKG